MFQPSKHIEYCKMYLSRQNAHIVNIVTTQICVGLLSWPRRWNFRQVQVSWRTGSRGTTLDVRWSCCFDAAVSIVWTQASLAAHSPSGTPTGRRRTGTASGTRTGSAARCRLGCDAAPSRSVSRGCGTPVDPRGRCGSRRAADSVDWADLWTWIGWCLSAGCLGGRAGTADAGRRTLRRPSSVCCWTDRGEVTSRHRGTHEDRSTTSSVESLTKFLFTLCSAKNDPWYLTTRCYATCGLRYHKMTVPRSDCLSVCLSVMAQGRIQSLSTSCRPTRLLGFQSHD